MLVTDVSVKDGDERVEQAFHDLSQKFIKKDNVVNVPDTTKQQVMLSVVSVETNCCYSISQEICFECLKSRC